MDIADFNEPRHLFPAGCVGFVRLCGEGRGEVMNERAVFFRGTREHSTDRRALPGSLGQPEFLFGLIQPPLLFLKGAELDVIGNLRPTGDGIFAKRHAQVFQIVDANDSLDTRADILIERKAQRDERNQYSNNSKQLQECECRTAPGSHRLILRSSTESAQKTDLQTEGEHRWC